MRFPPYNILHLRLKSVLEEVFDDNIKAMAEAVEWSYARIHRTITGGSELTAHGWHKNLMNLSEALIARDIIRQKWIEIGKRPIQPGEAPPSDEDAPHAGEPNVVYPTQRSSGQLKHVEDLFDDTMELTVYTEVQASAGNGVINYDESARVLHLPRGFVRALLGFSPPAQLGVLFIDGDSMSPTLQDGDMALYVPSDEITGDGLYIIVLDGALVAKRVQRVPGGGFHLISDNKMDSYRDTTLIPKNGHLVNSETDREVEFMVVGRVIWPKRDLSKLHLKQVAELIRNLEQDR